MTLTSVHERITRTQTLSQHEAAHYITAIALGFEGREISAQIQAEAHHGKSKTNTEIRCESLSELQNFVRCRALITLAGVMGEAINRIDGTVDAEAAHRLLEDSSTGAGQDYAVAKELIILLHNSLPLMLNNKTGKHFTSKELLLEILEDSYKCVSSNIQPILELSNELSRRVVFGSGSGAISNYEIEALPLFKKIKRLNGLCPSTL